MYFAGKNPKQPRQYQVERDVELLKLSSITPNKKIKNGCIKHDHQNVFPRHSPTYDGVCLAN